MKYLIPLCLAMVSGVVADRSITVLNDCPFVIWPAVGTRSFVMLLQYLSVSKFFTSSGGLPEQAPGWEAQPSTGLTFTTPDDWNGRIWGRRNCNFSTNPGPNSCLDGGCNGGLICNITTGTVRHFHRQSNPLPGVPPATLATFDFSGESQDIYTVSVVDGTNLP
ncbi:thaumatin, partial [Mycena haematopus]